MKQLSRRWVRSPWFLGLSGLLGLLVLGGCNGSEDPTGPSITEDGSIQITPVGALVGASDSLQFSAVLLDISDPTVTWSVDGAADQGTISDDGLYFAPPAIPWPRTATVRAASQEQPDVAGSAAVEFPEPDFSLQDINENSASFGESISPRDLRSGITAWYFSSST